MATAKTPIEIDQEALAVAAEVLGTTTKKDTVNAALREVGQRLVRLRALARLGEMADRPGAARRPTAGRHAATALAAAPARALADHARGGQCDRWSGHRMGGGVPSSVAPSSALHPDVR